MYSHHGSRNQKLWSYIRTWWSASGPSCEHGDHASQLGDQGHRRQTQAQHMPAITMPACRIGSAAQHLVLFVNALVCETSYHIATSKCYGKKAVSMSHHWRGCILYLASMPSTIQWCPCGFLMNPSLNDHRSSADFWRAGWMAFGQH